MKKILGIVIVLYSLFGQSLYGQTIETKFSNSLNKSFIHPGMAQSAQDLQYMKSKVLSGEQPWQKAFENLKKESSLDFHPKPYTHISVGAYGANDNGGNELFKSAYAAYDHALMWYLTGNKTYADKAIEILNAWAATLWDFDDNNAKLSVGLTAYYFLNAAEILKYTSSGWKEKDISQFKHMLLTVYYPTVKDFFTEANGNWDASIINTLLCIGIFTDNREIFNKALERFYHGPGNSGITKYIYPHGQIQESTRDWGHVQLGIGEFAKAAQVAWTQGINLYSVANDRLALGYEYTAKCMLDGKVPAYGVLSLREKERYRDIYEAIYFYYRMIKGIDMPYTAKVINQHTRSSSSTFFLTSARSVIVSDTPAVARTITVFDTIPSVTSLVGALTDATTAITNAVILHPGDSVQLAIDKLAAKGGTIILSKGVYLLKTALRISSNITLSGEGKNTILSLTPQITGRTIINTDKNLHDVTICNLLIEGATNTVLSPDPNNERRLRSYMSASSREGIVFLSDYDGQISNIRLEHVTVQNFTKNGVSIRGAKGVYVYNCDFSDNGSCVVPGAGFHHNLHLTHVTKIEVCNNRFDASPWGSGIDVSLGNDIKIMSNETARNKLSGIRCAECANITIAGNVSEGNDGDGILLDSLMSGCYDASIFNNISRNNGQHGILLNDVDKLKYANNILVDNFFW